MRTLSILLLITIQTANSQIHVDGPPPMPAEEARQQIRTLLEKVEPGNTQDTAKALLGLATWYTDLIDQELVAAWKKDDRAKLTGLVLQFANASVASGVVAFSWRERRDSAFVPTFAPVLESLMSRYGNSATPFLDDLLSASPPNLSDPVAETVCRILIDMPDTRNWKSSALQILPRYPDITNKLLTRDLNANDPGKKDRAQLWLYEFSQAGKSIGQPPASALARSNSAPPTNHRDSVPNAPSRTARKGVKLSPLDPAVVDDTMVSVNSPTALLDFVNRSGRAVDIYWIDHQGRRVLYRSGLAPGAVYSNRTGTKHPWLVVASGTGGTTARDSGLRIAGFQAETPNPVLDPSIRDAAIIPRPEVPSEQRPTLTRKAAPYQGEEPPESNPGSDPQVSNERPYLSRHATPSTSSQQPLTATVAGNGAATPVDLSFAYNTFGIYRDGVHFDQNRGFDDVGFALSANVLGQVISWDGVRFLLGPPNLPNVIGGTGQRIAFPPGRFTSLKFIGAAVSPARYGNGNAKPEPFKIEYSDGTCDAFSQRFSDWMTPRRYPGESDVFVMPYRNLSGGDRDNQTFHLYGYSFRLASGKIATGIVLPNDRAVKIVAMTLVSANPSTAAESEFLSRDDGQHWTQEPILEGHLVSQPQVIRRIDPSYSEIARREKVSGTVLLQLIVGVDGKAHDVKVIQPLGYGLDEKAVECVNKWTFKPATKDQTPVPVYATVEVNFRLL